MVVAMIVIILELIVIAIMHLEIDNLNEQLQLEKANKKHYKNQIEQLENRIIKLNEKKLPS